MLKRATILACILYACAAAPHAADADAVTAPKPAAYRTAASDVDALARKVIANYEGYYGSDGPRYYRDGLWVSADMGCWVCNTGPAVADAILARKDPSRLPVVVETMNKAIGSYQLKNGSFGGGTSYDISTAFFLEQLGTALIALDNQLPARTRAHWTASMVAGADFLIRNGDLRWYVNGNINLAFVDVMYMTWRVSREQRFADAYNQEWQFVTNPTPPRWAGDGLVITRQAPLSAPYDQGGSGYLTETGSHGPGFDPEYTQLQLDVASSLFVLSHDARALELMNLLLDRELPRISPAFILNATQGSRHDLHTSFMSSGLVLLARYGRPELESRVEAQIQQIESSYETFMVYTDINFYIGMARWLAPVMLDAANVTVVPPPGAQTAYLSNSASWPSVSRTLRLQSRQTTKVKARAKSKRRGRRRT